MKAKPKFDELLVVRVDLDDSDNVRPVRPKASDISDQAFLDGLNETGTTTRWDLAERLGYPDKVVMAKAKTMIEKRKTVDGCYCGCRGEFERIVQKVNPVEAVVTNYMTFRSAKNLVEFREILEDGRPYVLIWGDPQWPSGQVYT